ncbi:MAG TPA: hypothetical protein VHW43_11125, partial [Puia sp.]|nr:hypothetical protein [Puia sp.]
MKMNAYVPARNVISIPSEKLNSFNYKERVNEELKARLPNKYYPSSAVTPDTEFADFIIPPTPSMFSDLSSLTVTVQGRFVNADGSSIEGSKAGDCIIPKSFFKSCLFKSVEINLNETPLLTGNINWAVLESVVHAINKGYRGIDSVHYLDRCYFDPY